MAPESKSDSDLGRNRLGIAREGVRVDRIRWEWPNPKGEGLQKFVPHEHIVGMLSAVENGVKNGQRGWEGLVQLGIRSTNFCRFQLPNVWRGKGRQALQTTEEQGKERREPARTAVSSTRFSTNSASLCLDLFSPWKCCGAEMYYME